MAGDVQATRPPSPFATTVANVYGAGAVLALGAYSAPTVYNTAQPLESDDGGLGRLRPPPTSAVAARFSSTTSATTRLPDVCPVSNLPYVDKKVRWAKNEEVRLLCCLLGTHELTRGVSFLEYFQGARERQDLDRSTKDIEAALAAKFNDQGAAWPEYETLSVCQRYPPTRELRLPRRPSDLLSRWKKEIAESLKSFARAFAQSGRGSISEWDFATHPLAEFLYKVDPDLLVMGTGTLIHTEAGQIPGDEDSHCGSDDEDGNLQQTHDSEAEGARIQGSVPQVVRRQQQPRTNTKKRRTNTSEELLSSALQETISQQRELVSTFGQLADMFRAFMENSQK